MPLDLQVKLLRVLETGTFMRVGSTQVQETDVRLIAATNRDPMQAVARPASCARTCSTGSTCFPIQLPPLRERADDIPLIAQHFLDQIGEREGAAQAVRAWRRCSACRPTKYGIAIACRFASILKTSLGSLTT